MIWEVKNPIGWKHPFTVFGHFSLLRLRPTLWTAPGDHSQVELWCTKLASHTAGRSRLEITFNSEWAEKSNLTKTKKTYSNMLGLDLTQFIDMGSKIELENCASLPWCFVKQPFYRAFFPANGRPTSRLTITWSIWYKMLMVVLIKGWNGSSKDSWCSRGV